MSALVFSLLFGRGTEGLNYAVNKELRSRRDFSYCSFQLGSGLERAVCETLVLEQAQDQRTDSPLSLVHIRLNGGIAGDLSEWLPKFHEIPTIYQYIHTYLEKGESFQACKAVTSLHCIAVRLYVNE